MANNLEIAKNKIKYLIDGEHFEIDEVVELNINDMIDEGIILEQSGKSYY